MNINAIMKSLTVEQARALQEQPERDKLLWIESVIIEPSGMLYDIHKTWDVARKIESKLEKMVA